MSIPTQRPYVASGISIGTAAPVFAIGGDVAGPMSSAFHIATEQMGMVFSPACVAFTLAILIFGGLWIHFRAGGGCRAVQVSTPSTQGWRP